MEMSNSNKVAVGLLCTAEAAACLFLANKYLPNTNNPFLTAAINASISIGIYLLSYYVWSSFCNCSGPPPLSKLPTPTRNKSSPNLFGAPIDDSQPGNDEFNIPYMNSQVRTYGR